MPRCSAPSSTASAFAMPVLIFAGCWREEDAEEKRSEPELIGAAAASLGGGTQERLRPGPPAAADAHMAMPGWKAGAQEMLLLWARVGNVSVGGAKDTPHALAAASAWATSCGSGKARNDCG